VPAFNSTHYTVLSHGLFAFYICNELLRIVNVVCTLYLKICKTQIPVAARFKVWVCDRSPAEIAGSNHTGDVDV
jgi:hypothetical protein